MTVKSRLKKTFTAWSFSRFLDYSNCPARAKYKHLDKIKEPPSAAADRGTMFHKVAENYVRGAGRVVPPILKPFARSFKTERTLFEAAQKGGKKAPMVIVEEQWGFNRGWEPCAWDDWNNCWLRVKMDLAIMLPSDMILRITDHKTGKYKEVKSAEYAMQGELYAVAGLIQVPQAKAVEPSQRYLDEGITVPEEPVQFLPKDRQKLINTWERRVKRMMADTTFKPTPGAQCSWCPYSSRKMGPCRY